jgi:molecular chaperone DnaJ
MPISFPEAALGGEVEVPTLAGTASMKVPAGTPSGKVFRLRGKGLPVFGGYGCGDQLVTLVVEVPKKVTPRQRELIETLAVELGARPRSTRSGLLDRLRSLLDKE